MIINFKSYEEMVAKPNASDGDVGVIASTGESYEDNFVYLSNKVHDCVHLLYGSKCGWRNAVGRLIEIFEKMDKVNKT